MDIMKIIKDVISSRGVQILARYFANLLILAGTNFHLTIPDDDANKTATVVATFLGAVVCWFIDHFSHSVQKEIERQERSI